MASHGPMTVPDADPQDHAAAVTRLLALLDVEPLAADLFRGRSSGSGWARVYGGQVIGQALVAASRTVPAERPAHSLHAYFLRAGDPAVPIDYRVERDRDGGSFTTRRVTAIQHDRPIYTMAASFQLREPGLDHAAAMPQVTPPQELLSEYEAFRRYAPQVSAAFAERWLARERPFEFRAVDPQDWLELAARPPGAHNWFRAAAPVAADPMLARALLAYASDMTLLDTCLLPHAVGWSDPRLQIASLDHALWFHGDPPLDDWLLYAQDSPAAGGARGLNRGLIFARDGRLIASAVQEGLIRYRADRSPT